MSYLINKQKEEIHNSLTFWEHSTSNPTLVPSPAFDLFDKRFTSTKMGKFFLKHANLAIEQKQVKAKSLPELLTYFDKECKKGYCRGHAYERLLNSGKSYTAQFNKDFCVLFFQATHLLQTEIARKIVADLEPVEEELEKRKQSTKHDDKELQLAEKAFEEECAKRSIFLESITHLETRLLKKMNNVHYHGEKELSANEKLFTRIKKIIENEKLTSFVLGFHHKNSGHSIYIERQPSYKIFDANVGSMVYNDLPSLLSSLAEHIQKLQQNTEDPLKEVIVKKFCDPRLLEEIDILN